MRFVIIQSYNNYIPAHIAMGRLEEDGIHGWLKDEYTVTIDPILTNAVGGIKLMVDELHAEKAMAILKELEQEHKKSITCPKCGSHNIELVTTPRKAMNWISAMTTFFLGDFAIGTDQVQHCFECGTEFPVEEKNWVANDDLPKE